MKMAASHVPIVGIAYEDDAWDLHVHDEEHDAEYAPDQALLRDAGLRAEGAA